MEAGFLAGERGGLFQILHPPRDTRLRGTVLYVHPFAEELNKSRRMVACQARRLADEGYAVLLVDHFGCGDSEGDFGGAEWGVWVSDLGRCLDWLAERYTYRPVLWGLRTGCLLIAELVHARALDPSVTVFWQPVISGDQFLTQFLRLRMAAGMIGGDKESTASLRKMLEHGETLEVAGYELSPGLASALSASRLSPPPTGVVHWLDVVTGSGSELTPASRRVIEAWSDAGHDVRAAAIAGEPFWSTQEIILVPGLIDDTTRRLLEAA